MNAKENEAFSLSFPVVRGLQAGREYYITMCPLKTVFRITVYNEEGLPPDFRAQRTLTTRRIPEITRYILDNPKSYIFSALTVSVDSSVTFHKLSESNGNDHIGILTVPASAKFVINDGQHRRAAIAKALEINRELADESIPLVIFVNSNLDESQQMFADLNRYARRPTKSLSILYDRRDPVAAASLEIIDSVTLFKGSVEFEKTSLSARSPKLFTLSNVYQSIRKFLNKTKGDEVSAREISHCIDYWSALSSIIPEWRDHIGRKIRSSNLRREYIHAHGVVLVALGIAGNALFIQHPRNWKGRLKEIGEVDWRRSNTELWEGVAMEGGKISKAHRNVRLTAITLKQVMRLNLTVEELDVIEGERRRKSR